jgi:hypothetical protein
LAENNAGIEEAEEETPQLWTTSFTNPERRYSEDDTNSYA